MFSRPKSWLPSLLTKPKNPHSLDHLKYLYSILCKNQIVTEQNRSLLVETLRSISEILIWGDQNDSSVFDFFLEKSMLAFFLRYLRQKSGRYICVQLLQTLNIMFDNINNETSLYYLLSNNHINSIIVHKFDFSDEEVMAYYISFLKTLSLKLNKHTIHFFYNEHTNDFALYTEAIKFFNHSESMVRIAVRTITLNVFRVDDKAMLRYVRDRTASPYFSNLVWFIGNHILDLDLCVRNDADHQSRDRLSDLVAEHLDHLHYLNDILCINTDALNDVLTVHLLNKLFIPLYVYSLTRRKKFTDRKVDRKYVSSVVSLFLLSQVFLILSFAPLVRQLAEIIFQGEISLTKDDGREDSPKLRIREFAAPTESLARTLEKSMEDGATQRPQCLGSNTTDIGMQETVPSDTVIADDVSSPSTEGSEMYPGDTELSSPNQNSTDEEKLLSYGQRVGQCTAHTQERHGSFSLENRPYLEAIFNTLECSENDYEALFSLCLLYAIGQNKGIHQGLLDSILMTTDKSEVKDCYNVALVERLIKIITLACQPGSRVRLSTLELTMKLLKQLVYRPGHSFLQDRHLACIENARECSTQLLRNFYKSEEIFLDMFEDEYREMKNCPLNVEYLTMDASILLPPTGTPLTGIDFNKRLPCGEVERARLAIRVFLLVRDLSFTLLNETESQLPLNKEENTVSINAILDLNNSDLIACTILSKESRKQERRFLVIDTLQMILVEPDMKKLGWGIVRFVGNLQDIEVTGDKEDSRSLHITIHKPASSQHTRPVPLLFARFMFDDHIRCMAAKQRLTKGRVKARQQKMQMIEKLLEIQSEANYGGGYSGPYGRAAPGRSHPGRAVSSISQTAKAQTGEQQYSQPFHHFPQSRSKIQSRGGTPTKLKNRNTVSKDSMSKTSNCDDVEMAEEATSAFAFQSLNQPTISSSETRRLSGTDNGCQVQEIPLEDLSKKTKKRSALAKYTQSHLTEVHSRSHSHSPKRSQGTDGMKPKRGRSVSVTSPPTFTRDRSLTPVRAIRSKSSPIPMASSPSGSHSGSNSSSENSPAMLRSRLCKDISGQSPKSLRPALAPTLSLLPQGNDTDIMKKGTMDSPKLMPPAEVSRIRTVSDVAVGTSEDDVFVSEISASKNLVTNSQAVDSELNSQKPTSEAADELKRLAQMVQEHYKFPDSSNSTGIKKSSEDKEEQ